MKLIPKKSLGQNFLKDDAILQRIIESADISAADIIIEIGPGRGALTELLTQKCKKVIAIELDDRLVEILKNKFKDINNVEIIHDDILKINLLELVTNYVLPASGYKIVANLPYYITSPVIRLFLETEFPPQEMILMVQKEVAERICAQKGDMSILAISVRYYAKPKYLFEVSREAFNPMPKVDSAVIKVTYSRQRATNNKDDIKKFFRIVRAGFSAKRKTLVNNISNGFLIGKKEAEEKLNSLGFSKNTRAQELSVEDWKKLSEIITK